MTIAFPILAAAPAVDVDGTMLIQAGLFLGLYFVLRPLLFKPWIEVLERRNQSIGGALEAAEKLNGEVAQLEKDCGARLDRAKDEALVLRSDVRAKSESEQSDRLSQAREAAARDLEESRLKARREANDARRDLQSEVETIAADVFLKVMGRSA